MRKHLAVALKNVAEQSHNVKLELLKQNAKHEENKIYYCGYWDRFYKVLKVYDSTNSPIHWNPWAVTIQWLDNREIVTHCTDLNPERDFLVITD